MNSHENKRKQTKQTEIMKMVKRNSTLKSQLQTETEIMKILKLCGDGPVTKSNKNKRKVSKKETKQR